MNVEILKQIGSEWKAGDKHRVYFNDLPEWYGLDLSFYNTGNISSARLRGEKISNGAAYRLLSKFGKIWFDVTDGKFHGKGNDQSVFEHIVDEIKEKHDELESELETA